MCDSAQREVVERFERLRAEDAARRVQDDARRPNYILDQDARRQIDAIKEAAYQESKQELSQAWQRPADATPTPRNAQEGDACTVRQGGRDEGSPGHLRMVNGKLTCVPDQRHQDAAPRMMTMDQAQAIKDRAYAEMVAELTEAWKTR